MRRRAIAILALALAGGVTSPAQQQTAPVIDGRNGSVTISPQTLEWFRQRLAEEEERLRQLQITINQIARALPALQAQATPLTPDPSAPTAAIPAPAGAPTIGTPTTAGSPIATAPTRPATLRAVPRSTPGAATSVPSVRPLTPGVAASAPTAPRRTPRIAIPSFAPNRREAASGVTSEMDVTGSPVPIAPGAEDAVPGTPGAGPQSQVTTTPSGAPPGGWSPLAAPLRSGLTPGEVRQIKGAPAFIDRHDTEGDETWNYPDGPVTFRAGRLVDWGNRTSRAPALERVARRAPGTPVPSTVTAGGKIVPGTSKGPNVTLADAGVEVPLGVIAEPLGETAEPRPAATKMKSEPQGEKEPVVTRPRVKKKKVIRRHRRSRHAAWRSHRSRRWAWRHHRHHRMALRAHRPRSRRIARAHANCELCRMARAHLRAGHPSIHSKVAAWRTWSNRSLPPTRPALTARKRSIMRL